MTISKDFGPEISDSKILGFKKFPPWNFHFSIPNSFRHKRSRPKSFRPKNFRLKSFRPKNFRLKNFQKKSFKFAKTLPGLTFFIILKIPIQESETKKIFLVFQQLEDLVLHFADFPITGFFAKNRYFSRSVKVAQPYKKKVYYFCQRRLAATFERSIFNEKTEKKRPI